MFKIGDRVRLVGCGVNGLCSSCRKTPCEGRGLIGTLISLSKDIWRISIHLPESYKPYGGESVVFRYQHSLERIKSKFDEHREKLLDV